MPDASVADNMALAALPMFAAGGGRVQSDPLLSAIRALAQRLNLKSGDHTYGADSHVVGRQPAESDSGALAAAATEAVHPR